MEAIQMTLTPIIPIFLMETIKLYSLHIIPTVVLIQQFEILYVIPEFIIPNVFTPNGDEKNDIFYFTIPGALCFRCDIYNRWGKLIFELNDVNEGWNGTISQTGEPASNGVYYYIISYCDYKNISYKEDGFVQLIR